MQTLREEIKKRDDQTLKMQHEYEARIQGFEVRLQQEIGSTSRLGEDFPPDEEMELVTPEVANTLNAVAKKNKARSFIGSDNAIRNSTGQHCRGRRVAFQDEEWHHTPDAMMSDGDRRNAGTVYEIQEPESPLPVVGPL